MRKPGSLVGALIVSVSIGLTAPAASAFAPPVVDQIGQGSIPKPNGIAYDPYSDEVFVTSVGPPPRLYVFHEGSFVPHLSRDLPADSDPGSVAWGPDDYLYIVDHAHDRIFKVCPECGSLDVITDPASVQFLTGYIDGYQAGPVLLDFGNGTNGGSLWYGLGFASAVSMPDTDTPNGGEILPDISRPMRLRIADELLIADANHNTILRFSDTPTPSFLGTISGLPGNPGIQPPRDLDVNWLNLNPNVNGPAVHPIYVAFPNLGIYTSAGTNGPWTQVPANGIGNPTQVDSDCNTLGATSFGQNLVTFFDITPPKGSHCEDFVELLLKPESGTPLTLVGALKAYVDGGGKIDAIFGRGSGRKQSASAAKSRGKKLTLTAGKLTKFKLKLPAGVAAALRSKHKAVFRVRVRLTSPTGEKATVIRRVRIRR